MPHRQEESPHRPRRSYQSPCVYISSASEAKAVHSLWGAVCKVRGVRVHLPPPFPRRCQGVVVIVVIGVRACGRSRACSESRLKEWASGSTGTTPLRCKWSRRRMPVSTICHWVGPQMMTLFGWHHVHGQEGDEKKITEPNLAYKRALQYSLSLVPLHRLS
jgi:hypothetical protein